MAGEQDPAEENLRRVIPIVDTQNTEYEPFHALDELLWEVHGAAQIDRSHVLEGATPTVDARVYEWHPPMYWEGDWVPPLKFYADRPPHYKVTLAMWCPPMAWPPAKIMEGRMVIWFGPGAQHELSEEEMVEWQRMSGEEQHQEQQGAEGGQQQPDQSDPSGQRERLDGGPPCPPRSLQRNPPARPEAAHPGKPPTTAHIELADKAYTCYGEFEAARMRAYAHLRLPAPTVEIPVRSTRHEVVYCV